MLNQLLILAGVIIGALASYFTTSNIFFFFILLRSVTLLALSNEWYDIVALLYNSGADPTLEDAYGDSALDYFQVTTKEEFEEITK